MYLCYGCLAFRFHLLQCERKHKRNWQETGKILILMLALTLVLTLVEKPFSRWNKNYCVCACACAASENQALAKLYCHLVVRLRISAYYTYIFTDFHSSSPKAHGVTCTQTVQILFLIRIMPKLLGNLDSFVCILINCGWHHYILIQFGTKRRTGWYE